MSGHRRFQIPAAQTKKGRLRSTARTANFPPKRFWTICGRSCRSNTSLPRLSANGFELSFRRPASGQRRTRFGVLASTGISGDASGSIRAAQLRLTLHIPTTRAANTALTSPPMFNPFERIAKPQVSVKVSVTAAESNRK